MKCHVVRDLLPNYMDGVCSKETGEEIKAHLEECGECAHIAEQMDQNMEGLLEAEEAQQVTLDPMKKVRRRIRRSRLALIATIALSAALLLTAAYLTYGQIAGHVPSFSSIYEYFHMRHVGTEFAKGNIDPLLDVVETGWIKTGWQGEEERAIMAEYGSEEEYRSDIREAIKKEYQTYFADTSLELQKVLLTYDGAVLYDWQPKKGIMATLVFSGDASDEYILRLYEDRYGRFVVQDEFTNLESPHSLFSCLPDSFDKLIYQWTKEQFGESGEYMREGETDAVKSWSEDVFCNYFADGERLDEDAEAFEARIKEHLEKLWEKNYYFTALSYGLPRYDKKEHRLIRRLFFELENSETKEKVFLTADGFWVQEKLVIIPGSSELTGSVREKEVKKLLLEFFVQQNGK